MTKEKMYSKDWNEMTLGVTYSRRVAWTTGRAVQRQARQKTTKGLRGEQLKRNGDQEQQEKQNTKPCEKSKE